MSAAFRFLTLDVPFSLSLADSCISWSHVLSRNKSNLLIPASRSEWPLLQHLLIHERYFVLASLFSLSYSAGAGGEGDQSLSPSLCMTLGESLCSLLCCAAWQWGGNHQGGGGEVMGTVHEGLGSNPPVFPIPSCLPALPTTGLREHNRRIPQPQPQEARANSWWAFNDPKPLYWLRRQLNLSQG